MLRAINKQKGREHCVSRPCFYGRESELRELKFTQLSV